MTENVTFKQLPGVLSFQRCMLNSDALFFDEIAGDLFPLSVIRHGIRGTQNVSDSKEDATSITTAARNVSNIQVTESAKTSPDADALVVKFDLRMLDLSKALFACAGSAKNKDASLVPQFRASLDAFTSRSKVSSGMEEVANRIARNVLNGRWLWRNRVIAETMSISVMRGDVPVAEVDAFSVPMNNFDDYSEAERKLGAVLCSGLRGETGATVSVKARLTFGVSGAIEVFPSQNYVEKSKGFARSLYKLGVADKPSPLDITKVGQAAMRDQKLGNALRTIDTWYPDYDVVGKPIPVEPNGASLDLMEFKRNKKSSAFTLLKRLATLDVGSADEMYCIAALIRGGVYSESSKNTEEDSAAKEEVEQ